jgi:uncharacterized protein (DUF3820 family)
MKAANAMNNLDYVGKWTIKFGKHKGRTFADVAEEEPNYLMYLMQNGAFDNEAYAKTNKKIKDYIIRNADADL